MSTPDHTSLVPTNASVSYPRAYLLGIYTAAIEQGFVWITPLTQADAASLRAQLLRLRRRADTANKSFISSDHYLVTFGGWQEGPDGRGRMPATFNRLADGATLPTLQRADGSDVAVSMDAKASNDVVGPLTLPAAGPLPPPIATELADASASLDIDDFVSKMIRDSEGRQV